MGAASVAAKSPPSPQAPAAAESVALTEAALPAGYVLHFIDVPLEALQIFPNPRFSVINVRGEVIGYGLGSQASLFDAEGRTIHRVDDPVAPGTFFHPESLSDRSAMAGSVATADPLQRPGWFWSRDSGLRQFEPSGIVQQAFIADDGMVVGRVAETDAGCNAFAWDPATMNLREFGDFCARALSHAGLALGTRAGQVATLSRDGSVDLVGALAGQAADPVAISDDGRVFVNLRVDPDRFELGGEQAAVASGSEVQRIGLGLNPLPPGTRQEHESASLQDVSRAGHAIGTDRLLLARDTLPDGSPCFGVTETLSTAFYWTPQGGTTAVEMAVSGTVSVVDVNAQGIVAGLVFNQAGGSVPFVWSKASGGVMLESLVTNLPASAHLVGPSILVGDGGHVLSYVVSDTPDTRPRGWVILTPTQAP